jgi:light-regulated signal transduction histidine kinase (bacteriophytochrome)
MLVCDEQALTVTHHSANAAAFLCRADASLLNQTLVDLLGETVTHDLRNAAAKGGGSEIAGVLLDIELPGLDQPVDAAIHRHKGRLFVELERSDADRGRAHAALDLTQSLIRRIGLESDTARIAATGAKLIRAMLGYDRVMVYRFLHNGAGHVIAEAKAAALGSFLGQHFPASDIPYQARRLYLQNSIRTIVDSNYIPSPLVPPLRHDEGPLDMSFAQLRSVSPIHCEYLRNMGVAGTMSISIIVDGELWGLIACHHDTAKVVPLPLRIGAELFGQYFSLQIAVAERRAEFIAATVARERLDRIISNLDPDEPVAEALRHHLSDLAALVETDGAGLWIDGRWESVGAVPPEAEIAALVAHVRGAAQGGIWTTEELRASVSGADAYEEAVAGLLAVPISARGSDLLLLFRAGEAHAIEWAGEPVKTVVSSVHGDRLTPRGSFETWREDVRGRSAPWSAADLAVAEAIRTYLRDVLLRYNEITADARARDEQRRRVLNDELNHRVKNIISLVKSIALQTGAHAASVADYSKSLEGRLRALAFAHDQSLAGNSGDLTTLIEAEASLHRYSAFPDRVTVQGPPVGLDDRTFGVMALVVHEMMTNAAKYGALSVPEGRLAVRWSVSESGDCSIDWSEIDGPEVRLPTSAGFGSKLITTTIEHDLGGSVEIGYDRSGLQAHFVLPSDCLRPHVATQARPDAARPSADLLAGLRVLLVEDQALIGLDTEDTLRQLGAASVILVPGTADARCAIAEQLPDCAILDFNLGHETAEHLNPIEQMFAKLKALLRKVAARTRDALWNGVGQLISTISSTECRNFITNSGYAFV